MKYLIYTVIAVVVAALVTGILIVGSPQNQRASRFDEQRTSHLQNIQWQIMEYYRVNGVLPVELAELDNELNGYKTPDDPETNTPYVYEVTGDTSFELCATFNRPRVNDRTSYAGPVGGPSEFWEHEAGYVCFDRSFDETQYQMNSELRLKTAPIQ